MPKTKISEFSSTPASNTDIDSINISEGCAPSGINDAIRELMAQLKDFQTGAVGDSFNGPVGTTTAAAGAFTTLSSTGNTTLGDASGDSVTINGTATFANANPTLSAGTANGVAYLNGSKVVTSGSALTFDGSKLTVTSSGEQIKLTSSGDFTSTGTGFLRFYDSVGAKGYVGYGGTASRFDINTGSSMNLNMNAVGGTMTFQISNSEQMRLTSTGLGIGTTSPNGTLQLSRNASSGNFLVFDDTRSGFGDWAIYKVGANDLTFGYDTTAGSAPTQALTLAYGGNLGLGVTPSAWNTSYKGFQMNGGALQAYTTGDRFAVNQNAFVNSGGVSAYVNTGYASQYLQLNSEHRFYTAPSGTAGNAITFTQAMTLDASGNLLVGRSSGTGARIDVYNSGSGDATIRVGNAQNGFTNSFGKQGGTAYGANAIGDGFVYSDSSLSIMADNGTGVIKFSAGGNTERARIDSSGNLLVGTTSAITEAKISAVVSGQQAAAFRSDASTVTTIVNLWGNETSGNQIFVRFATDSNAERGSITYNRAGGLVAYNVTSDYRAKDISGPVTNSGALIDSTPVYMGKMKGATQERPMFIAHETPAYAHTGVKDAVDADGNPVYQQMDASALIPVMWAEIQSLRKRLADAGL